MAKDKEYQVKDHQLFISPISLWRKLKRENDIAPSKRKLVKKISWFIILSTPFQWLQSFILLFRLPSVDLSKKQPVFVIGYWRSGTTHLHYLLAQDKRFSYLENFQAFMFRIAFVTKWIMKPVLGFFMPSKRPQDNIEIDAHSPAEEEHPLVNLTEKSGMQSFFFPKNRSYFDKYNVFEGASDTEIKEWKRVYLKMLKQIALFQGKHKQLLLKNPHNTGRVKVLLELFPEAKFIYIHRNPYDVFQSNVHLYNKTVKTQFLQEFLDKEIEERVLYSYEKAMGSYLNHRSLIPKENLVEIGYDELSENPIPTLEKVYQEVSLDGFESVKPALMKYLESQKNYKRNRFNELSKEQLKEINTRWKFAFDEWNYPTI